MPSYLLKTGSTFFSTSTDGDYTVRFYDYDGTLLKSQGVTAGRDATAPTLPAHEGLTFDSWNNTFANVQRNIDVGAIYETSDGKTHALLRITTVTGLSTTLFLNKSDGSTLSVDYGDGVTETFTNTGNFNTGAHVYPAIGDYTVKIWISSGSGTYGFGNGGITTTFVGGNTQAQREQLIKLWVGNGTGVTSIGASAFQGCRALASIVLPSGVTSIGASAFQGCRALASIVLPSGVTSIGTGAFDDCYALASIVLPSGVTSIGTIVFRSCFALASIVIPADVTSIGTSAFQSCIALASIVLPSGVTSIGTSAFQYCYTLASIVIPADVTSIGTSAFLYCYTLKSYEVLATVPPTLADINAFTGILASTKIFVPDASVSAYKTATNWINWENYIYPISEMP